MSLEAVIDTTFQTIGNGLVACAEGLGYGLNGCYKVCAVVGNASYHLGEMADYATGLGGTALTNRTVEAAAKTAGPSLVNLGTLSPLGQVVASAASVILPAVAIFAFGQVVAKVVDARHYVARANELKDPSLLQEQAAEDRRDAARTCTPASAGALASVVIPAVVLPAFWFGALPLTALVGTSVGAAGSYLLSTVTEKFALTFRAWYMDYQFEKARRLAG